jgi:hypothetical protein
MLMKRRRILPDVALPALILEVTFSFIMRPGEALLVMYSEFE